MYTIMSDDRWNDDVAYAFSIHKTLLGILGLWPLQKKTIFTVTRWGLITILELMTFAFLFMEFIEDRHATGASIESILFFTCTIVAMSKNFSVAVNTRKLAKNIDAAINDWLSTSNDQESYMILKKYTFKSRLFTLIMLYSTYTSVFVFSMGVVYLNAKQTYLRDTSDANNTINWMFPVPSGTVLAKVTSSQCATIIAVQTLQMISIGITQCVTDGIYINVTLHLSGQLETLKIKLKAFASKLDSEANYKRQLIGLINRHRELLEFNQNLEDTFHLVILLQLVVVTILLALLGLRIIFCLKEENYIELAKNILALNYVFVESLVYTGGADSIEKENEDVFNALFTISWFRLPVPLMKDLYFVMMKARCPLRLSGGKFFYANRETMMHIFQTAASYVSVLRVAMTD